MRRDVAHTNRRGRDTVPCRVAIPRRVLGLVLSAALGAACRDGGPRASRAARAASTSAPMCEATGAHAKHDTRGIGCDTCHPCGSRLAVAGAIVVPGDATTPTTCTTSCHHPFGATPRPVPWIPGPLACTDCHDDVTAPDGTVVVSSHHGLGAAGGPACAGCHDTSDHGSGAVRLVGNLGGTGGVDVLCKDCHSGTGGMLLGATPPLLVGWTGPFGDRHGEAVGDGYGGTLRAPYTRRWPPLPCTTCHDAHASGNAFLLASAVNGVPMLPGRIGRNGVGAEQLCEACHSGDRHARCAQCHESDPRAAGSACFSCHTHEDRVWAPLPSGSPADYHDNSQSGGSCDHCHEPWSAPIESTAPVILYGDRIGVTVLDHEATITWSTNERATSFVEYGVAERGFVAGGASLTPIHSVRLTGLTEDTLYSFRVRTSDAMRNVTLSGVRSFMTLCSTCASAPLPVANGNFDDEITATAEVTGAWWRDAYEATYCGRYASTEMNGPYVLRIAASPLSYWDDELGDEVWYGGYGTASYRFSRTELDLATTLTFDVRPKLFGSGSAVTLTLLAFDLSGALITDTADSKHVADIIGTSSPFGYAGLRIAPAEMNSTYTRTLQMKPVVVNALQPGKTWADVQELWITLQATSGDRGAGVDVYFDDFR
jgi:hypothetical protein